MRLGGLLLRQWSRRPGRALAAAASVAVAVGAVVATWTAADASRQGYQRLTEAIAGVPTIDVTARDGQRFDASAVPRLADVPGVRAVVPLFYRPSLVRVGESRLREVAVGVDVEALVAEGLLALWRPWWRRDCSRSSRASRAARRTNWCSMPRSPRGSV